ncbi:MAG: HDOD domain-containing protein [Desulfovibrio sp.]|nr:MAG: HDOD domain-containing protein [Desulfovibrio sp.]
MTQATKTGMTMHQFFATQPVFNRRQRVWGHELIYRGQDLTRFADVSDDHFFALERSANAYATNLRGKVGGNKMMRNFTERSIMKKAPSALDPKGSIVEVSEASAITPEFIASLDQLKKNGYRIAVDDFEGLPGSEPLLERADLLKIDILEKRPQDILKLCNMAGDPSPVLVAKNVDYIELFNLAKAMGFSLFQGTFFKKAEILEDRKLTSSELTRMELFKIIETGEPDFKALSAAISKDASISYRLLVFLNSAAFSFPTEITSIDHAVVLLGWQQIKTWLRIAILNDLSPSPTKAELIRLASQRSSFFKLAAQRSGYKAHDPDKLFLLGLFSLLEPIMDMFMEELVESLPVDDEIKAGLCREKNVYSLWIEMASRMEAGHWSFLDRIVAYLKLDPHAVAKSYYDAHVLTNSFYDSGA